MTVKDLNDTCFNLYQDTNVKVIEKSKKEPVKRRLKDIYDEISNREVAWFYVENEYTVLIKLKREE